MVIHVSEKNIIQTMTYYLHKWKKEKDENGDYHRYDGELVKNQDLIKKIDVLMSSIQVQWVTNAYATSNRLIFIFNSVT